MDEKYKLLLTVDNDTVLEQNFRLQTAISYKFSFISWTKIRSLQGRSHMTAWSYCLNRKLEKTKWEPNQIYMFCMRLFRGVFKGGQARAPPYFFIYLFLNICIYFQFFETIF